ncbi:hypothetical protein MUK42_35386 [Musa troglodytarum]|uniref:Uncharacterized protein n=1 Tax=Musa troglodytarum TaxID=320322 RepID=A0A9E7JVE5_9LILI|nr:hypothetical protein MUK42_35386 [Musa troglodytarum]
MTLELQLVSVTYSPPGVVFFLRHQSRTCSCVPSVHSGLEGDSRHCMPFLLTAIVCFRCYARFCEILPHLCHPTLAMPSHGISSLMHACPPKNGCYGSYHHRMVAH